MITDPIADMLTVIRNANRIYRDKVEFSHSALKESMVKKLKQEGFIQNYERVQKPVQDRLIVYLKYGADGEKIIRELQRVSKSSRRVYKALREMNKILGGMGIAIVSTPKGILTDSECRAQKVGGEVLCTVW
jgi:small subunit ribosomal protein S8